MQLGGFVPPASDMNTPNLTLLDLASDLDENESGMTALHPLSFRLRAPLLNKDSTGYPCQICVCDLFLEREKPKWDHRSRIFELEPCDGYGKVCLVYRNTAKGTSFSTSKAQALL